VCVERFFKSTQVCGLTYSLAFSLACVVVMTNDPRSNSCNQVMIVNSIWSLAVSCAGVLSGPVCPPNPHTPTSLSEERTALPTQPTTTTTIDTKTIITPTQGHLSLHHVLLKRAPDFLTIAPATTRNLAYAGSTPLAWSAFLRDALCHFSVDFQAPSCLSSE